MKKTVLLIISLCLFCCSTVFAKNAKMPSILLVFNGHYDTEAENLLASIKKNVPEFIPHIVVCVSDENSKNFAVKHKLRYFEMSTISDTGTFMTRKMNIMTRRKLEAIVYMLERDETTLYIDTDIVLLHNPLNDINTQYDLNIQSDQCQSPYDNSYLCTGFMYIKPNSKTIKFYKEAIYEMVKSDYKLADQTATDLLISRYNLLWKSWFFDRMTVNVLDVCKFPNGCRYFDQTDVNCERKDALIVHNNYLVGIEKKRKRFAENGLLFYKGPE